jgi:hypothetical protein
MSTQPQGGCSLVVEVVLASVLHPILTGRMFFILMPEPLPFIL